MGQCCSHGLNTEHNTFFFFFALLPLLGAMKQFSLFISKILCVCLVGFLQAGRVMISRSEWPTQGALNQRGGSGEFCPAHMSFISSRSVDFKVAMSYLIGFCFSRTARERYWTRPCGVLCWNRSCWISNRLELYRGLGYYWLQQAHTDTVQCLVFWLPFGSTAVTGTREAFLRLDNRNYCKVERDLIETVGRATRAQIRQVKIESANGQTGRLVMTQTRLMDWSHWNIKG